MIPHVIVLEPGLVIYKICNGCWFFGRPTMEELRHDLRAVLKKCRPDWDITTPELKAAGSKAARNSFIRTARRTPKMSVNEIRSGMKTCARDRSAHVSSFFREDTDLSRLGQGRCT